MKTIDTQELVKMKEGSESFKLIEVLPEDSYNEYHIPQAINVPNDDSFKEKIQKQVDKKDEKVVVYCMDEDCSASEKAAKTMENMGYNNVYDYAEGKAGWREAGKPVAS